MPDSFFSRQAPKATKDYDEEVQIDLKEPSVLGTLNYKWERNIFLDAWWDRYPKNYDVYFKAYKKNGKNMIDGLEERDPQKFIEIFNFAEAKARKIRGPI